MIVEANLDESVHSATRVYTVLRRDLVNTSGILPKDDGTTTITTDQAAELVDLGRFAVLGKMQGTF